MLLSTARLFVILGIAIAAMEPGAANAGQIAEIAVGERVECDAMQLGRYKQATVIEVLQNGAYRIRYDDDRPGLFPIICLPERIRIVSTETAPTHSPAKLTRSP